MYGHPRRKVACPFCQATGVTRAVLATCTPPYAGFREVTDWQEAPVGIDGRCDGRSISNLTGWVKMSDAVRTNIGLAGRRLQTVRPSWALMGRLR